MVKLRVREAAEAQGITSAAELARRTGLAFAKANELWKNQLTTDGKRSVGLLTLYRVAQALNVKIVDLYAEGDWAALYLAMAGT